MMRAAAETMALVAVIALALGPGWLLLGYGHDKLALAWPIVPFVLLCFVSSVDDARDRERKAAERGTKRTIADLEAKCAALEWERAEALALVLSHEEHIARLEAKG